MSPIFRRAAFAVIALLIPLPAEAQFPRLEIEVEGGSFWQSYNDVEIPNDGSATRFSLHDLAGAGPWPAGRLYVTWNPGGRHGVRLLLAPLSLTETGVPDREIRFSGATFTAGQPTQATYTFNSYRLTYRYLAHSGARTQTRVGVTAKIRDAEIALRQGETSGRKDDLGFVPLLHLAGEWRFAHAWSAVVDLDGLAGGPGRAVDASLEVSRGLGDRWAIKGGYRTVEGGADVAEVYSFAWLHYAVASLVWRP